MEVWKKKEIFSVKMKVYCSLVTVSNWWPSPRRARLAATMTAMATSVVVAAMAPRAITRGEAEERASEKKKDVLFMHNFGLQFWLSVSVSVCQSVCVYKTKWHTFSPLYSTYMSEFIRGVGQKLDDLKYIFLMFLLLLLLLLLHILNKQHEWIQEESMSNSVRGRKGWKAATLPFLFSISHTHVLSLSLSPPLSLPPSLPPPSLSLVHTNIHTHTLTCTRWQTPTCTVQVFRWNTAIVATTTMTNTITIIAIPTTTNPNFSFSGAVGNESLQNISMAIWYGVCLMNRRRGFDPSPGHISDFKISAF